MLENPACKLCPLHQHTQHVCVGGSGRLNTGPRLLVLIDHPTRVEDLRNKPMSGEGVRLLHWMFARMGMTHEDYFLEYVVKCCPKEGKMPSQKADRMRAIQACSTYRYATLQMGSFPVVVALGRLACEAMTGSDRLKDFEGTWWEPTEAMTRSYSPTVWIGPNVNAVLMNPAIAQELYRVLWAAAVHALYKPVTTKIAPFDWSEFIK